MTSKLNQKATSILAVFGIALLLVLIILLWVLVGHGTFRKGSHVNSVLGVVQHSSSGSLQDEDHLYYLKPVHKTNYEEENDVLSEKDVKEPIDTSHVEGYIHNKETEFVKPLKISPPPLHDHDIIYDQIYGKESQERPSIRHHSGHFRHKMAEIWDPHPEYEISAFGKKLHLILAHNDKFVLPTIQVTHVWNDFTQNIKPEFKTSGCYYTGKVKGEEQSNVAVSLCGGMTGYISSNEGSFYIEPVEKFQNYTVQTILHKIHKVLPNGKPLPSSDDPGYNDHCDTDELPIPATEEPESPLDPDEPHHIHKRETWKKGVDLHSHRASNQQYYIETLVVADKKMVEYHKTEENLLHYILILMSHVALLYKDATIGNPITMVVVKILIMKEMEFVKHDSIHSSSEGVSSSEMLRKFCAFQKDINVKEPHGSAVHHDIALLLTRENMCRNYKTQQCDTLGLAELGSMCNPHSSCAIIEDKGLPTSYTIAHELGHVLSMPHDDDPKCRKIHGTPKMNNIMGRMLQNDSKPWLWSVCSKYFLTEFVDSNRAHCLLNRPETDLIVRENMSKQLPGETFSEDRQCEFIFQKGSKICSYMPRCGSLWCTIKEGDDEGCRTIFLPWADGTSCDAGKWCHRGECVARDRGVLQPIDGAWGPWQPWGPCTRPCGGGVRRSERVCDSPPPSNGGQYCTGRSSRYMSCNIEMCDPNMLDFRAEQCAAFNGQTKGLPGLTTDVKWVPKYAGLPQDVCKLYCRVSQTNSYYLFVEKVIDGTKCSLHSYNICVNGICHPAGCDNMLNSNKTLDECGVCGGDNSKCQEISGKYNTSNPYGYNKVLRIPKGSSSIDIRQNGYKGTSKDDNYLALVDSETGEYILNGNFMVSTFRKVLVYAGVTVEYSGSDNVIERVNTSRSIQLKKDLIIEVLSVGRLLPSDISYSYKITSDSVPKFSWQLYGNSWTPCSSICSGTSNKIPTCVEIENNRIVSNDNCSDLPFDGARAIEDCNTHCMLSWKKVTKSPCSAHCGQGVRQIQYQCARIDLPNEDSKQSLLDADGDLEDTPWAVPVDELHCSNVPRPADTEPCEGPCDATRWDYSLWSECTKTCGGGIQTRTAQCVDSNNNEIDSSACEFRKTITQQVCNTHKCPRWAYIDWTPCSVSCGKGFKTQSAVCQNGNEVVSSSYCDSRYMQIPTEDCFVRPCTKWVTGDWSQCTASCGKGMQKREILCKTYEGNILDDVHCNGSKPENVRFCSSAKCPEMIAFKPKIYNDMDDNSILPYNNYKSEWRSGPWSECSKSCNGGTMSRMVACQNEAGIQTEDYCDPSKKPLDKIQCNTSPCPNWNVGAWSACDSSCLQYRQVICQHHKGGIIDDSHCHIQSRPTNKQTCMNKKCRDMAHDKKYHDKRYYNKPYDKIHDKTNAKTEIGFDAIWTVGAWSTCSKSCGRGLKTRHVSCVDSRIKVTVVDHFCNKERKPKTRRHCIKNDCSFTWVEGPWSQCTVSCGEGLMYRNVTCHKVHLGGKIDSSPVREHPRRNYCENEHKPLNVQKCLTKYCNELYSWFVGSWRECSHQCGRKGRQVRHLSCHDQKGNNVPRNLCSKVLKPPRKRKCNQRKCNLHSCRDIKHKMKAVVNKEYEITIKGKRLMVYCHNMNHSHPQEFLTLPNEGRENYAEIYDKKLVNTDSCPFDGSRKDTCHCVDADSDRSGLTVFSKVRLNITSLQIIGNDFTFSRQIKGKRISYGTAGDCYSSRPNCPQGRFSIDLTGTRLRLAPRTTWVKTRPTDSMDINIQDNKVSGKCGGYCGHCEPDHSIGLALEIV